MSTTTHVWSVKVAQDDDGAYIGEVLELPGCIASGESLDELTEALGEAISLYISTDFVHAEIRPVKMELADDEAGTLPSAVTLELVG